MEPNELIGYAIIVAIVTVLVCVQFKIFSNNCRLIKEVQSLFPSSRYLSVIQVMSKDEDNISETDNDVETIPVSQIERIDSGKNHDVF